MLLLYYFNYLLNRLIYLIFVLLLRENSMSYSDIRFEVSKAIKRDAVFISVQETNMVGRQMRINVTRQMPAAWG